ncbi:hypothetical protein D477_018219 [Arthrobacter crystallopoietes BAB-32]|uniref:TnpV protein n=1 Tax=Arthrobacter crystallopoietes BAB-32 TaxID=1246476 RepID=N1UYG4_9MICC|nr:hypothetical protein [Arthrobacter crystallopoietes]EMY32804.1 hypothetical protein D477_018219 [Arthrobacter crystallopoietes BAB-32]
MNRYGAQAQKMWQEAAPTRYRQLEDPEEFFSTLGRQAEQMVGELIPQIAGPDPAGEGYLVKVGRLNAAKLQAEEIVRADLLAPPEIEDEDENVNPDLQDWLDWKAEAEKLRLQMLEERDNH